MLRSLQEKTYQPLIISSHDHQNESLGSQKPQSTPKYKIKGEEQHPKKGIRKQTSENEAFIPLQNRGIDIQKGKPKENNDSSE